MSEDGVPTGDMPDSQQPPFWGPAYHDRDLDALLSGDPRNTPVPLRPVESTLAALRAAPTGRELSHEAAARAAFRAIMQPGVPRTPPAEYGPATADTLILPPAEHLQSPAEHLASPAEHLLSPADRRPPRAVRHRRRRSVNWGGHRSAIALMSVAAVVVVVIAVAVTGGLPGSIGHMVSFGGQTTSAAPSAAGTGQTPGSLEGTGVRHPTPTPAVHRASSAPAAVPTSSVPASAGPASTGPASTGPSSTTGPTTLCRELLAPSGRQNRTTRRAVLRQLTQLAGGRHKIMRYCFRYLSSYFAKDPRPYPTFSSDGDPGGPGDRGDRGTGNPEFGFSGGKVRTGDPFPSTGPGATDTATAGSATATGPGDRATATAGSGTATGPGVRAIAGAGIGTATGPGVRAIAGAGNGTATGPGVRAIAGAGNGTATGAGDRSPVGIDGESRLADRK